MGFTRQLDLKKGTIPSIRIPEQTFTEQERAGESPESPRRAKEIRHVFSPSSSNPSRLTYRRCTQTVSYSRPGKDKQRGNSARFT